MATTSDHFTPLLVRASAGTGKTYRLAGRLLAILIGGAEVETVLATTFTRKAAGEILQRILVTLAQAASDPIQLDSLRAQVGNDTLDAAECRKLLHRLMRDIHKLKICTLDSFFSQLARSFPFELGLPPGWRLSDEIEEVWLRRRAIDRMLESIESNELAALISMLGKGEAIRSIDQELQSIILDGYVDSRWCGSDAWDTLQVPAGPDSKDITIASGVLGTAVVGHKSADKNLMRLGADLESRRMESLFGSSVVQAVASSKRGATIEYYKKVVPEDVVAAIRVLIDFVKTETLSLIREQTKATGMVLIHYAEYLDALKQQTRVVSFDDVAFRLAKWINSVNTKELSARMDASILHVLLDEFQDTSPVQWSVLRPFAKATAASPPKTSFFCVGDVKQAIYGWRGGRAAIFDAVASQIQNVTAASQDLSYRSSPVIMALVNNVFKNLTQHPKYASIEGSPKTKEEFESVAVEAFARDFPVHLAAKENLPGFVRFCTSPDDSNLLRYAADEIARLAIASPDRTIGVLTRTNRSVAELIFHLKRLNADVSQEGGNPLTDSAPVEIILSALMISEHPGDLRWAYHVSHSPLSAELNLPPLEPSTKNIHRRIEEVANRIRRHLEQHGLSATVTWLAGTLIPACGETDATRLRQLLNLSHAYEANPQPRLSNFVDLVRRKRVERPRPAKVRVMTIHQSKGLEFDTVVLPELDSPLTRGARKIVTRSASPIDPPEAMLRYLNKDHWALLPPIWRDAFGNTAAATITEALCLLYVAITRPRAALHIIIPPTNSREYKHAKPASLIFHALGCPGDPTQGGQDLFTSGDHALNTPT